MAGITLMGAGTFGSPAGVFAADRNVPTTGGAAACDGTQECIQPTAVPSTGNQDGCTGIAGLLKVDSLDSSDSYWHFVVPDSEGYELNGTAFNASFAGANTEFTVTYVQQQKDGGYKAAVVEADGGVTLSWAFVAESGIMDETTEAEGTGAEDTDGNGDFVLSSTCAGSAASTTSTSSSSSTTSSTQSTTSSTQSTTSSTQSTTSSTQSTTSSTQSTTSTSSTASSTPTTTSSSTTTSSTVSTPTTTSSDTTSSQTTSSQSSTALTTTVTDPSTSTSSSTPTSTVSSSSSSASNPSAGVLGANTTTPSTGADVEFGFGIALLLGGAGVMIGATRINRNKRQ